ncbi:hypothetical protein HK100_002212 [Physocladia obscura]|uniref:adenosine deaminase n=1 Tax=Physocladia obscura TaxID=109957 RepID=A0AAD5XEC7_9FUNG|nr:hypothetical protein HK100_002212 [Physocladia obscura]
MTNSQHDNSEYPAEFLLRIPKTDLHCHLDGSIRLSTLIELAAAQSILLPAYTVSELKEIVFKPKYLSLEEYLECFKYTTAVLRNPDALVRVAYELAIDQFSIGVRYSPQLLAVPGVLTVEDAIEKVHEGLARACTEFNALPPVANGEEPEYKYGIILCAIRHFTKDSSPWYKAFWEMHEHEGEKRIYGLASVSLVATADKLRTNKNTPIVGVDIAGAESGFPAEDHKEAFSLAHKKFFFKTVHAGEGYGPESIFQAITDCHAERIGHGFHIFDTTNFSNPERSLESKESYVEALIQYMSSMRVCIEVCLTSNLQTLPNTLLEQHPARKMIEKKMAISLCSDNMTVSSTNVLNELKLAIHAFKLTPWQVKDITMTGFKRSFMFGDYVVKRAYNRKVIEFYDKLAKEYGVISLRNTD